MSQPIGKRDRFSNDFEIIDKLGEGEFGIAYKVRVLTSTEDAAGTLRAVKQLKNRYEGMRDRDLRMQEVTKAFNICPVHHISEEWPYQDFCVGIVEAWEEFGYLYISSELCERGDLNDYIDYLNTQKAKTKSKKATIFCTEESAESDSERNLAPKNKSAELLPEKTVWELLADMARAVKHVHDKGFIHLDIKPSNFFVTSECRLKLGDFGIAINLKKIDSLVDSDQCGDSVYMAPELLKGHLSLKQRMTQKVDIFSLGVSVLEIASSMNLPQNGLLWQKLREGTNFKFSPSANRSAQLEQLITMMMEPDPQLRPDIDEVLLHPQI